MLNRNDGPRRCARFLVPLAVAAPLLAGCTGYQPPSSYGDSPPGNGWYREMPDQGSLWEMPQPAPPPRYRPPPEVPPYSSPEFEPPKISPPAYANNPPPPVTGQSGSPPASDNRGSLWQRWFGSNADATPSRPASPLPAPHVPSPDMQADSAPKPPPVINPNPPGESCGWWRLCNLWE